MLRCFLCLGVFGLLLASCSTNASMSTQSQHLPREAAACRLLGTPPKLPSKSAPDQFFAMAVPGSLISALGQSDNSSLERVAGDLRAAAREETRTGSTVAMVRALTKGDVTCHRLGLSTAK
jgi:hypothetical protein